jgi:hypothetical protein
MSKTKAKASYRIVRGAHIPAKLANKLGQELTIIAEKHGGSLRVPDVLEEATKKKVYPAVHSRIEWDVVRAARLYQEHQVRMLMCSIEIEVVGDDGVMGAVRAFHSVDLELGEQESENEAGRGYVTLERIASDVGLTDQVIETARTDLATWKSRYDRFRLTIPRFSKEFSHVFQALEKL